MRCAEAGRAERRGRAGGYSRCCEVLGAWLVHEEPRLPCPPPSPPPPVAVSYTLTEPQALHPQTPAVAATVRCPSHVCAAAATCPATHACLGMAHGMRSLITQLSMHCLLRACCSPPPPEKYTAHAFAHAHQPSPFPQQVPQHGPQAASPLLSVLSGPDICCSLWQLPPTTTHEPRTPPPHRPV